LSNPVFRTGTFPYADDLQEAPYTDGLIGGGITTSVMVPTPQQYNGNLELRAHQGTMIPGGNKDSDMQYVNCNRVWYPIFAGDF